MSQKRLLRMSDFFEIKKIVYLKMDGPKQSEYRRLVQYDKTFNGNKLKHLLEWHEISHIITEDRKCLIRWMDPLWLIKNIPNYEELDKERLVRRLTSILTRETIREWKDIIIEYCIMDFLINAEFGIKDTRGFDTTEIFAMSKNNHNIISSIKNNIKFSTDGYSYGSTILLSGNRDFELTLEIMKLWTEHKILEASFITDF